MSRKAVSFIHDILTEVLTDWNEPSHFHFNEALFRPFERIMQLELCDEDVQDQASQPRSGCLYLPYHAQKKNGLQSALGPLESVSRIPFKWCPLIIFEGWEGSADPIQHCGRAQRQNTWL